MPAKIYWVIWSFMIVKYIFFPRRNKRFSTHPVHIHCPIWVKYVIRDQHTLLLTIYEFREKGRNEVRIL